MDAIALASQKEPADMRSISQLADGINHAVPTHAELKSSLRWLEKEGLISRTDQKYTISSIGQNLIASSELESRFTLNVWYRITSEIEKILDSQNEKKQ